MTVSDRYARQRLIEWWDQDRLRAARVLVAGAGALGNEVLKNLTLLGVGRIVVIDFDEIEESNLSRTVLFTPADVGRPKVTAAVEACARINPEIEVQGIRGDVRHDVGLGYFRHSGLVIGCLDNLAARSHVGQACVLAGVPYLDGGMWPLGGEVRWFTPGDGPCFDCLLSDDDRRRQDERYSCSGLRNVEPEDTPPVPTVATTASVIGGLLGQEAAKWLCGHPVLEGRAIVFDGGQLRMHRAQLTRNPACPSNHRAYQDVRELPLRAADTTPRQLLARVRTDLPTRDGSAVRDDGPELILELGRDWLMAFDCPGCGRRQEVRRLLATVLASERICRHCGGVRHAQVVWTLEKKSPWLDLQLSDLGVPPGEILAVRAADKLGLYELTGDI